MIKDRIQNLRRKLTEAAFDGILVSYPYNRRYLSGFTGSDGYVAVTADCLMVATDFRYFEQVGRESPDYTLFKVAGPLAEWFPRLIGELGVKSLAFESEHLSFAQHRQWSEISSSKGVSLMSSTGTVESLRTVKEPEELENMQRALDITHRAFDYVRQALRPGMTELELGWQIEKLMRESGSQPLPFEVIVASGPNAALPHAHPSDRPIGAGEPVVVDIGARHRGYSSDLTRTFCAGSPDETFRKVYDVVLRAQQATIDGIRVNMTGEEADRLARSVIEQAGYADAFGHGTGHGVGLETHELPRISPRSTDRLANGMVFTVEPGIYIPGWGGVRIEDDVILENDAARVLDPGLNSGHVLGQE